MIIKSQWPHVQRFRILFTLFLLIGVVCPSSAQTNGPELLTYEELVALYDQPVPTASLQTKLTTLLNTPFVVTNPLSQPLKPRAESLGTFLRVVAWNIEQGLEFEAIQRALAGETPSALSPKSNSYKEKQAILEEAKLLTEADVIILNEADWGMKRTDYRNVAAELAATLKMNYAYGVEFVEVDPVALGREQFGELPENERRQAVSETSIDKERLKGLHGTAILSRYPLENVRVIPFKLQPYDWYRQEKKNIALVEKGKRRLAEAIFLEKIMRQVRRGGRMMLLADIVDTQLPEGRVTIVATHLENQTTPKNRRKQLDELLLQIKEINNPVILAGDMNTSSEDSTPTSVQREIKKRLGSKSFWLKQGLSYVVGFGLIKEAVIGSIKFARTHSDPTVRHVPFVAPNPTASFFESLKDFRFKDGRAFDFRGDRERSASQSGGTFANSNQRGSKGFVTTYEVKRRIAFVGKFKLDWIFVKPADLTSPEDASQPYRFAPHFGRTLKALNYSLEDRISDHSPILVDLPLNEPTPNGRLASSGQRPAKPN